MAHRSDLIPVNKDLKNYAESAMVSDPNCGKEIERKSAKHILFRPEATFYFCSRECLTDFTKSGSKKAKAA